MTTTSDLERWFQIGLDQNATHMIVVCDTFDHEDYPVYVEAGKQVRDVAKEYDGVNMQRIMEVYSLSLDMGSQMDERRAFHWD